MRLMVLFDLPNNTEESNKRYLKFRNFLKKNGYYMLQYSVYVRICPSPKDLEKHKRNIIKNCPDIGNIKILALTEKQYSNMISINHEKQKISETSDSLLVF